MTDSGCTANSKRTAYAITLLIRRACSTRTETADSAARPRLPATVEGANHLGSRPQAHHPSVDPRYYRRQGPTTTKAVALADLLAGWSDGNNQGSAAAELPRGDPLSRYIRC